ncbi:DUF927 domain-containing protein [Pararhodobacter oceanensis]|uniref:DUF927 domain-containing protein n=1 Tax=Pararhodobacter oceanensis TaxID=2172121 RepID=UPI003A943A43
MNFDHQERDSNETQNVVSFPLHTNQTKPKEAPPGPPMADEFQLLVDGLYMLPADESDEPVYICTPIRVDATFADEHNRGWGRVVNVQSAGTWHEIPVKNAELQCKPSDVVATLVDHGLELGTDKRSKERLLNFLKTSRPTNQLLSIDRMGWIDDSYKSFAIGSTLIGRGGVLPPPTATGVGAALRVSGAISGWRAQVGEACRDNPQLILAVSLAFSAPLLAPLDIPGGGLHFRGASSSGKTTLMNVAASVWGGRELITQWRATSNGLEAIAATLNDMLLPLDEIGEISARDLDSSIYMLANGTGKSRMGRDATLADPARWRLAIISSGEVSVAEKLNAAGHAAMAGQEVRLIDVEADSRQHGVFDALHGAASAAAFAEDLQRVSRNHFGAVGQAFVQNLIDQGKVSERDRLGKAVDTLTSSLLRNLPASADGQTTRVAKRFAVIAVAGSLATEFSLTGWAPRDALAAAKEAFLDWYDRRHSAQHDTANRYVKALKDYINAHGGNIHDLADQHTANPQVLGWKDAARIYLPDDTWNAIFPAPERTKAASSLRDVQILVAAEKGRLKVKAPRAIPDRPRVYALSIEALNGYSTD